MTLVEPQPVTGRELSGVHIRQMTEADLESVIRIHRESFPGSRSTELGGRFLKKMYKWFINNYPDFSLIAVVDSTPSGLITGSLGSYSQKLFRYTLPEVAFGFVTNPRLLLRQGLFALSFRHLKGLFTRPSIPPGVMLSGQGSLVASLGSIAVGQRGRGKNVGDALMRAFENAAMMNQANSMFLSVKVDNTSARRLYERCGWQLTLVDDLKNMACYAKTVRKPMEYERV
jgi:ribosomal protein S18 acetylase RimI-like enzyme